MSLADALEHARARNWDACLSATIAAWRIVRQPAFADLIDRICVRAAGKPMTQTSMYPRIRTVETESDADLGELVGWITGWLVGAQEIARRRPPDPRISRLMVKMFLMYGNTHDLLADIEQLDDPREVPRLREAAQAVAARFKVDLSKLLRTLDERPPLPALSAEERATIAAIDTALAAEPRPDALAAIYADPDSTDARLVWADALLQVGDVRGELIALQCRTPGTARERELLKMYRKRWLGPLAKSLLDGAHYRRGFPAVGRYAFHRIDEVPDDREWQTFEDLDVGTCYGPALVPFLMSLRGLWAVRGFPGNQLHELERPRWTRLGVREIEPVQLGSLDLPSLVELDFADASFATVTHALAHYGKRLERIRLPWREPGLPPLADLRRHAKTIELVVGKDSLIVDDSGARIEGRRGAHMQELLAQLQA